VLISSRVTSEVISGGVTNKDECPDGTGTSGAGMVGSGGGTGSGGKEPAGGTSKRSLGGAVSWTEGAGGKTGAGSFTASSSPTKSGNTKKYPITPAPTTIIIERISVNKPFFDPGFFGSSGTCLGLSPDGGDGGLKDGSPPGAPTGLGGPDCAGREEGVGGLGGIGGFGGVNEGFSMPPEGFGGIGGGEYGLGAPPPLS
tara:strand:- start:517 stop:1113 length:597 start_codon:yes stop_codon:yes gene_type:complete